MLWSLNNSIRLCCFFTINADLWILHIYTHSLLWKIRYCIYHSAFPLLTLGGSLGVLFNVH